MHRPSFLIRQEDTQTPSSTEPTRSGSFTRQTVDNQIFPVDSSRDSTPFQQQYDLTSSFGNYTQASSRDVTQTWTTPQQQYIELPSPSPVYQGLPPLVPQLNVAQSLISDEEDDTSAPTSPPDETTERRKERRRAQNRAAQRAFRARKEDTIKESWARLEALQQELIRLESVNGDLLDTVSTLRSEVATLREENAALMSRHANGVIAPGYAQDHEGYSKGMLGWTKPVSDEHEGNVIGFGLNEGMIGTVQWQDTGGLEREKTRARALQRR